MAGFQTPITIHKALSEIQSGHYLLPAFQREFVWKHYQIEMLFDSLMREYPINSMLFWKLSDETGKKYRFYRMIKDFVEVHRTKNEEYCNNLTRADYAVLDGQQRLTSLYIGFCGTYAYRKKYAWAVHCENNYPTRRLYLDISREYSDDVDDKHFHFEFLAHHAEDLFDEGDKRWLRVGKVLEFADLRTKATFYRDNNVDIDQQFIVERLVQVVHIDKVINFYEEDTSDPDKAVSVFSRINSGGTALSYADILLAITVANWKKYDARNEIRDVQDKVNAMGFNITHDYVLKSFLYLKNDDVRFKIGSFDNDFITDVEEHWIEIKDAIVNLFALLKSYGLDGGRLTSNYATLPVLLYLYRRKIWSDIVGGVAHRNDRDIIKRWLMKTLLLRTFGYRSDGSLRKSRHVLNEMDWQVFPAGKIESALGQTVTDEEFFQTLLTYRKDNRYTWVVLSLLYQNLVYENIVYHADHMHSAKECQEKGISNEIWDSVLNLQLLPQSENESKGAMPLKEWVDKQTQNKDRNAYLESHLIPDMDLKIENFDVFIEVRKEMLISRLKELL